MHEGRFTASFDFLRGRRVGAKDFAVGADDLGPELRLDRRGALILDAGDDLHLGRIASNHRRGDVGSPVGHVDGIENLQPHVAENARPGVPAAARLYHIDAHGQDVLPLGLEGLGQVVVETREAVGMPAQVLAVEPHIAIHVDAVELDPDTAVFRFRGRGERLAVPANAAVQISAALARRRAWIEGTFDTPVVRHVEQPPRP